MRKLILIIVGVAVLAGLGTALSARSNVDNTRNWGASAVVTGGTFNQSEMNSRIKSDAKALFKKHGISTNLGSAKSGTMSPSGNITVNGEVVATNAETFGREARPGSKKDSAGGTTFYRHSTKVAFDHNTPVFVFFDKNGHFKNAVAKVCGNPIIAKPKVKDMKVCLLDTGKIVTIKETSYNTKKHSKYLSACNDRKVCELSTGKIVTIKQHEYNKLNTNKYSKDLKDCEDMKVCELKTGKVVNIHKHQYNSKKHSTNLRDCVEDVKVCELETGKIITIKADKVNSSKHSKNLADCDDLKVCELETGKVITIKNHQYNGNKHSKNLRDCVEDVEVCDITTGKIVTVKADRIDNRKHTTDLEKCDDVEVCELETGNVITIKKHELDEEKHSTNLEDCDAVEVCELETKNIVTIKNHEFDEDKHSKNLEDCDEEEVPVEEPETPVEEEPVVTELPQTGAGSVMTVGLLLGAAVAAGGYYSVYRRS